MGEDITRLPKWAQDKIKHLQYERDAAVNAMNKAIGALVVGNVWYTDVVSSGETRGPSFKQIYVPSREISFRVDDDAIGETGCVHATLRDHEEPRTLAICYDPRTLICAPHSYGYLQFSSRKQSA